MAPESDAAAAEQVEPVIMDQATSTSSPVQVETALVPRRREGKQTPILPTSAPILAIGAVGISLVGGLLGSLLKRSSRKKGSVAKKAGEKAPATAEPATSTTPSDTPVEAPHETPAMDEIEAAAARDTAAAAAAGARYQGPVVGVDLSPFGSPVGDTPVRLPPLKPSGRGASVASNDGDDASDNASVRDQRSTMVDAAQLQKTLKQMQEMAEENRKLSQFLTEYKMDAEKLSKLEQENQALRDVTRQLEQELQELKVNALPRTGAELEAFKNNVRVPAVARSVCSNDETVILGPSTASVDGTHPDARVRRQNVFTQLLAHLQGGPSAGTSQPATPRSVGGAGAGADGPLSSRQRKQPRPEEAAAIGQAVYQLLDSFGGRMM